MRCVSFLSRDHRRVLRQPGAVASATGGQKFPPKHWQREDRILRARSVSECIPARARPRRNCARNAQGAFPAPFSRRSTSTQRARHSSRSASGRAARAATSRTPARSGSIRQWSRARRHAAASVSSCLRCSARSARSQSRARPRSSARADSSGGGSSLPRPQPASAAAQAAS